MKHKNIFFLAIFVCCFSIADRQVVAATILRDEYGIAVNKIDSPQYLDSLKTKISLTSEYSPQLAKLLEKHFELLLTGAEDIDNYIEFYKKKMDQSSDHILKNAYRQRVIRGLLVKNLLEMADVYLKELDLKCIESNTYEFGYHKLLRTYFKPSGTDAGEYFKDAIDYFCKNKLLSPDLAYLYYNYGMLLEKNAPEKAYNSYKKGLMTSSVPTISIWLLDNIQNLIKNNKSMKEQIFQDILASVNLINDNDHKLKLMICLLKIGFFASDLRKQRKLMDMFYACLDLVQNPVILLEGYYTLACQETKDNNLADVLLLLSKYKEISKKNQLTYKCYFAECWELLVKLDIEKNNYSSEQITHLNKKVLMSNISDKQKVKLLVLLAKATVIKKDWESYDIIVTKTKENSLYTLWGIQAVNDILLYMISHSNFSREDVIYIAESIDKNVIEKITTDRRLILHTYFTSIFSSNLANAWQPSSHKGFWHKYQMAEQLSQGNKDGLKILNNLEPTSFSYLGREFTKNDAEMLILCAKLGYFVNMKDISNINTEVNHIIHLLPKCSVNLVKRWGDTICGNLAGAYVTLGETDKAISLLTTALSTCSKENIQYGILTQTLGVVYLHKGDLINAKESFCSARKVFKVHKNWFLYVRASVNLANVMVTKSESTKDIADILTESISIATQYKYNDDLSRAYMVFQAAILKDRSITRAEKIKRFYELEKKCVQSTDNPTILADYYSVAANIKDENNFPAENIIADIEKYFEYQKLFSNVFSSLSEDSYIVLNDQLMKKKLFSLLEELGDTKKIDYWNKIFERDRMRSVELQSQQAKVDTATLPLLALIAKFENAQQILANEQSKQQSEQDKFLIQKALKLKREIEQQYELAKKNLPAKDLKSLEALLADNFIIPPDSLGQLSSILPEGTACLQFLNVGENIIAYIAVKNAPPFTISISLKDKGLNQKKFSQKLIKVRALIQNRASVSTVNKGLAELYKVLFIEIEEPLQRLGVRSIVINASGILRYVPLATLYDGKKYLVEKYQITNITGLDLIRLTKNSGERRITDVNAVIFADPDGTLPVGKNEGEFISKLFQNVKLYIGNNASLDEFESMLGNVNFIHLATHAKLDPDNPANSYILFAKGKKWKYSDMMGFNVQNIDSIVLSACSTAISEKCTGGEIEGMAYQLLKKSPSGSVLASFWDADDAATAEFMVEYYQHITNSIKKNHSLDRGGALRQAQLTLLKKTETSHPYYWAAFTLFGDFR